MITSPRELIDNAEEEIAGAKWVKRDFLAAKRLAPFTLSTPLAAESKFLNQSSYGYD
jgi:hypothetical protein